MSKSLKNTHAEAQFRKVAGLQPVTLQRDFRTNGNPLKVNTANHAENSLYAAQVISQVSILLGILQVNPLSANPTKWSNTLKQFVGCCR